MNDKQASAAGWAEAWADMQKHYWDAWSGLAREIPGRSAAPDPNIPHNPWVQGLDFWSKLMAPALPKESQGWMEKLIEINKGYLQLGENLHKAFSTARDVGMDSAQWLEPFNQALASMQQQITAGLGKASDPWNGFATLWGLPADTWKRLATACSVLPGDMEKAFRDIGGSGVAGLGDWLSTPTLGYTRESQEEIQRLGQFWLEHAQAAQAYAGVLSRVVNRAAELLRDRLQAQLQPEAGTCESLRACYDLWVDCGEEAYAEVSVSEEFTHAQARLTNSLMAVKRQEQKMVDEWLGALNMPTRRELDTSHRRVHQLQRQVWRLQQKLDDANVQELREELAALKQQVKDLTASKRPAAANPSSPPARPSAKPKTAT